MVLEMGCVVAPLARRAHEIGALLRRLDFDELANAGTLL
jgi:hypothetical protein